MKAQGKLHRQAGGSSGPRASCSDKPEEAVKAQSKLLRQAQGSSEGPRQIV